MRTLTLDSDLRARFGGGAAKVTLTDEAGKTVGHYLPDDLYRGMIALCMPDEDEFSRETAVRDYHAGKIVTTEELLAHIRESLPRWRGEPG